MEWRKRKFNEMKVLGILLLGLFLLGAGLTPADAATLTLRWAHPSVASGMEKQWTDWYIKEMEKRTEGRLKAQIFWGGSLVKITEMAEATKSGLCDIGWVTTSYHKGYGDLNGVSTAGNLFAPLDSPIELTKRWLKLYDAVPAFYEEYKKTNLVPIIQRYYDVYWIFSHKPVRSLDDLKGMKIRAVTEMQQVAYRAIGAMPMFLPAAEIYSALQKRILDAVGFSPDTANRYKIQEVTKAVTRNNIAPGWAQWCMNLNTFNKLSEADRKAVLQLGKEASMMIADLMYKERERLVDVFKKAGMEIFDLPQKDIERWEDHPEVKAFTEKWMKEHEEKGLPARETMSLFKKLMSE